MSKKILITEFKAINKPQGKLLTVNLEEYLRKNRGFSSIKDGKCFSMTIYKGNYRNNDNVVEHTGVSFDFDDVTHDDSQKVIKILNEMGIHYITYLPEWHGS